MISKAFLVVARLFASDVVYPRGVLASIGSLARRFPSKTLYFSE